MPDEAPLRIKPVSVLFCDEVRREDNGKHILIGVYQASILVTRFPATLALAMHVSFEAQQLGDISLELELRGPLGASGIEFGININEETIFPRLAGFTLPRLPVEVPEPTDLTVALKQPGQDWEIIGAISVRLRETDSTSPARKKASRRKSSTAT